jgi:hypothetical protein
MPQVPDRMVKPDTAMESVTETDQGCRLAQGAAGTASLPFF